ncbi:hypothetical protein VNO77_19696 [Canavalia gladiata]|uniref:Uncharacterized protein n=1 Tax=Canavalia gladiata TaxID=3824 RepID=A0AAN9LT25_CANGL
MLLGIERPRLVHDRNSILYARKGVVASMMLVITRYFVCDDHAQSSVTLKWLLSFDRPHEQSRKGRRVHSAYGSYLLDHGKEGQQRLVLGSVNQLDDERDPMQVFDEHECKILIEDFELGRGVLVHDELQDLGALRLTWSDRIPCMLAFAISPIKP